MVYLDISFFFACIDDISQCLELWAWDFCYKISILNTLHLEYSPICFVAFSYKNLLCTSIHFLFHNSSKSSRSSYWTHAWSTTVSFSVYNKRNCSCNANQNDMHINDVVFLIALMTMTLSLPFLPVLFVCEMSSW